MQKAILYLLLSLCGSLSAQVIGLNGQYRKVIAKSGLNMRSESNSDAQKVGTLPYGTEVFVEGNAQFNCKSEIDGVYGHWVQVQSGDKSGYVFDAFLSPPVLLQTDWQEIGTQFQFPTISVEENWFGLFLEQDNQLTRFRKMNCRDTVFEFEKPCRKKICDAFPYFMISGIDVDTTKLYQAIAPYSQVCLTPGAMVTHGNTTLYAIGDVQHDKTKTGILPITGIKDFKVIYRIAQPNVEVKEQVLVSVQIKQDNRALSPRFYLSFFEDMDQDGFPDVLLLQSPYQNYSCWGMFLFLSSKARDGRLLELVAESGGCSC